jgi:CheY-like chemotaxis protein
MPFIVCLTAFTEEIFEQKARQSGMKQFVSKPITNMKLRQILQEQKLISMSENQKFET